MINDYPVAIGHLHFCFVHLLTNVINACVIYKCITKLILKSVCPFSWYLIYVVLSLPIHFNLKRKNIYTLKYFYGLI